ncbi:hypothetical protein QJQ45_020087, partial [Haematococcus lacustris]
MCCSSHTSPHCATHSCACCAGNDILALHNAYRAAHSAPALSWDSQLQSKAQSWANNLASNCQFYHSGSGENLASGFASWADAAYAWYVEYKQYNYNAPGYSAAVGHFTQMVWLGTTKLGCATANSKCSQGVIYVCQYDPPGNVNAPQYFRDNMHTSMSGASDMGPSGSGTGAGCEPVRHASGPGALMCGSSHTSPHCATHSCACCAGNDILALHNAYRAAHSAPALSWDSQLQSKAQSWANNLASNCQFYHSGSGENLASGFASWADAAYAWYVEYKQYNYNAPGYSAAVGHFTQMVWLGTTKLGCATANSKCSQGVIYVCQYDPPGNVNAPQYFRDNMHTSMSGASDMGPSGSGTGAGCEPVRHASGPGALMCGSSHTSPHCATHSCACCAGNDILALHNAYRAAHSAPALSWDSQLQSKAQSWANNLASNCQFYHSGSGENLASGFASWADAAYAWYVEYKQYNYNAPGYSAAVGHFTQMVWLGTTKLGCATANSKCSQGVIYVCQYDPPGNVNAPQYFRDNMHTSMSGASDMGPSGSGTGAGCEPVRHASGPGALMCGSSHTSPHCATHSCACCAGNDILALHNAYRAAHSAPALSWDSQLQSKAQSWANNLASNCQFYHSGSGENLASGFASWADAAYAWYVEYKQYNYNAPGYSAAVGHFTQMVWLGTTKLGCATANSKCSQGVIYVCQYDPPGNVNAPQYFRDNMHTSMSGASDMGPSGSGTGAGCEPVRHASGPGALMCGSSHTSPHCATHSCACCAGNDILALHNAYRAAHSAPALSWDYQLQSKAQSWANNLASNCQFYHSGSGENLASGFASWADAAYAWYVEYKQYNYNAPGYSAAVGHFTQMVWLGTTKLGCATANSKCSQGVIYVCQYDPPGNVNAPQYFRDNMHTSMSGASDMGPSGSGTGAGCEPVRHASGPGALMCGSSHTSPHCATHSCACCAGNDILALHNAYRAAHSAPALSWDSQLQSKAQSWANNLASNCQFYHSGSGENLASGFASWADAAYAWYVEYKQYNYNAPGYSAAVGHFTQMVWLGTTKLGCATANSKCSQGVIYVCQYDPPGNVNAPQYFRDNMHTSMSGASDMGPSGSGTGAGCEPVRHASGPGALMCGSSHTSPHCATHSCACCAGNDILALHNAYRAAHSAPALSWDSQLQSKAQSWANNLASNCQFYHSGSGENLASGFASWADAAYAWYVEYKQYNYNAPGYSAAVGHFTQ